MIQFNLLPDIKQQYMKAQRQKHMVVFISTLGMIIAVAIFVVLLLVTQLWQKKSISDLNGDIKKYSSELSSTDDFSKILTVQNQLKSLPALHDKKAVASRLSGYMTQLTPGKANVSKLDVDFAQNTISISGSADSLATVNTYVDTLKFTTFSAEGDETKKDSAFSSVVLAAFGKNSGATTYTITANFDPIIFSGEQEVTLTVPQITSSRSATEQPTDLFQATNGATQ
jgi:Tfp pilus assembly protein PilN